MSFGGKFPVTSIDYEPSVLYQLSNKGFSLGNDLQKRIGSMDLIYPAFIHFPNNTRLKSAKDFWEKVIEHLEKTAWVK